jgi:hypothetical protein
MISLLAGHHEGVDKELCIAKHLSFHALTNTTGKVLRGMEQIRQTLQSSYSSAWEM